MFINQFREIFIFSVPLIQKGTKDEAKRLYKLLSDEGNIAIQDQRDVEVLKPKTISVKPLFDLTLLGIDQIGSNVGTFSDGDLDDLVNQEYSALLREDALPLPEEGRHHDPVRWWRKESQNFLFCTAWRIEF